MHRSLYSHHIASLTGGVKMGAYRYIQGATLKQRSYNKFFFLSFFFKTKCIVKLGSRVVIENYS